MSRRIDGRSNQGVFHHIVTAEDRANGLEPPPITIEYVDTESANVQLRLPKGEGGLELFHRRSRQRLADRFEEKMKSLEIPSLMEKARERLEDQVSQVKSVWKIVMV